MIKFDGPVEWSLKMAAGSFMAPALMVTGKGGHTSATFGPFLGPTVVALVLMEKVYHI